MRRRRDIASIIRNVERPSERKTSVGVASSIARDGMSVNGQTTADGEVRDLMIALPYGISSSGMDGMRIQVIINDNNNNVAVGVIDKGRPAVKSGCLKLYDKAGSSISLNGDGSIDINAKTINIDGERINIG